MNRSFIFILFLLWGLGCKSVDAPSTKSTINLEEIKQALNEYDEKGLWKSALQLVNEHLPQILAEEPLNQSVWFILQGLKYHERLKPGEAIPAIEWLELQTVNTEGNTGAILQSILAEHVENYWERNAWRLREISYNPMERPRQMEYWSARDLLEYTDSLYAQSLESLSNPTERIILYDSVIHWGYQAKDYNPSIYYLIMDRYLRFWMKDHQINFDTLSPGLEGAELFQSIDQFKDVSIPKKGKFHQILQFYQQLLQHSLDNENDLLTLKTDLDRLSFVWAHFRGENRTELYEAALEHRLRLGTGSNLFAEIASHAAQYYLSYQNHADEDLRVQSIRRAKQICEKCISTISDSSAQACQSILDQITQPVFNIQMEDIVPVQKPILALVNHKNIDQLDFKLYRLSQEEKWSFQRKNTNERKSWIAQQDAIRNWNEAITNEGDYIEHRVEIKIDGLPAGYYLLWSEHMDVKLNSFSVSDLSILASEENGQNVLYVLDRMQGNRLENVFVELFQSEYDRNTRQHTMVEFESGHTDANGRYLCNSISGNSFHVKLTRGTDSLFLNESIYFRRPYRYRQPSHHTYFFTDRSIYRPGQLLHFKGILIARDDQQMPQYQSQHKVIIELLDPNGQVIDQKHFQSNEFGSFDGQFVLPEGLLKGGYQLRSNIGSQSHLIQVEEYKRPRFTVVIDSLKQVAKFNQPVTVMGMARAYTGFGLENASVKYRITELPVYHPYFGFFSRFYRNNPILIGQGNVQTDVEGRFNIEFIPIDALKSNQPKNYRILVEVTDQSGETHSAERSYNIDEVGRKINIQGEKYFIHNEAVSLSLVSETNQGLPHSSEVKITVHSLEEPQRVIRKRVWNKPDQWNMSYSTFIDLFPHDPYENEDEIDNWKLADLIETQTLTIKGQYKFSPQIELSPGAYRVVVSDGALKDSISFYISEDNRLPIVDLAIQSNDSYHLDDSLSVNILIHGLNPKYVFFSNRKEQLIDWEVNPRIDRQISESDQGGIQLAIYQIYLNRSMQAEKYVPISWSTKEAAIKVVTFRDHILPGSQESWKVSVRDHLGNPMKGMLTSTLYDASLDAIYNHHWSGDWFPRHVSNRFINFYGFNQNYSMPLQISPNQYNIQSRGWFDLISDSRYLNVAFGIPDVEPVPRRAVKSERAESAMSNVADEEILEEQSSQAIKESEPESTPLQIRKNLKETVFFYGNKLLDEHGEVQLDFMMNEALTKWNWKIFVHGTNLQNGYYETAVITEKKLMVFPNFPRIIREGDVLMFPVKIRNEQSNPAQVSVKLELYNPLTTQVYTQLISQPTDRIINIDSQSSVTESWEITIPESFKSPLAYRIVAEDDRYSDGEEGWLPVLSNEQLVFESIPFSVSKDSDKKIALGEYFSTNDQDGLKITLEVNEQPLYEVIRALPLLLEDNHPNAISCINRIFGHSITQTIFESHPEIKTLFQQWSAQDGLQSALQQNEELKQILLKQTPWLDEALQDTEHQKLLHEVSQGNILSQQILADLNELSTYKTTQGGFSWIKNGRPHLSSTLYILDLVDKLIDKDILQNEFRQLITSWSPQIWQFLDEEIEKRYQYEKDQKAPIQVSTQILQYLYLRIQYEEYLDLNNTNNSVIEFYKQSAYDLWVDNTLVNQIRIAELALLDNRPALSSGIVQSILERAEVDPDRGMHWPQETRYYFTNHPIIQQVQAIELLKNTNQPDSIIQSCKDWLISNKQTQLWSSSPAVANAVYSLLQTRNIVNTASVRPVSIVWGNDRFTSEVADMRYPGYWKVGMEEVKSFPEEVTIVNPNSHRIHGGIYAQYFQKMDEIKSTQHSGLKLSRTLYYTNNDGTIVPLDQKSLKPGDRVRVVLKIRSDFRYEFVHIEDVRGAGLEPLAQISQYKYQSGLGYYQSPGDAGQDFFITVLPEGEYVLEYDCYVVQEGYYSAGNASIQCLYAPEYGAHSAGEKIRVQENL